MELTALEALEALALADDRDAALSDLVPGTEDHDYWRAIRLQNLGDLDAVDRIVAGWRHGSGRRDTIDRRQLLLRADRDLTANAAVLANELDAKLDHHPEVEAESARHPTRLDPAVLDPEPLLSQAVRRDVNLGRITDAALPRMLQRPLTAAQRRQVLTRLQRTGLPGLVDAIAEDLAEKTSNGFTSLPIHHRLTVAELVALADRVPELRHDTRWVQAMLVRTRPADHVDTERDPVARRAWLDALWDQVRTLPPRFRSLQAHVLYRLLALDLHAGQVDRERLLTYLALPRRTSYGPTSWAGTPDLALLNEDFSGSTGLPAVYDDEPVVRALLAQLLATEDGSAFRPFVDLRWLDLLLAETRLLAGDPDVDRWTTILGAAGTTALRDRVDLELLPTNRRLFGRDEPVVLDVAIKNPDLLRIRVFRVDTAAHFQSRGTDIALAIDLDGLAAGWEDVRKPTLPPMRRVTERLVLPACDRPGTWVVELVGNGRASRALVRKGDLRAVTRRTPGGLGVTVLDEAGTPRPEASLWMGGHLFRARPDGEIPLPFTTRPGELGVLLCDGELAVPTTLRLPAESYALRAVGWLDRQALAPGRDATCVLRLDLTVDGAPTTLSILEEPWAEITIVDRNGVPAVRREVLTLADDQDTVLVVAVPEHLTTLTIAVGGRVRVVSEQRTVDLRSELSIGVGGIHDTPATDALFLARSDEGWSLCWLGKNGEPRPGTAVTLALTHTLVTAPIDVTLATDRRGRVTLGPLPGVREIRARTASGLDQRFDLGDRIPQARTVIHVLEGEDVSIPVVANGGAALDPEEWSVVELRGGAPAVDRVSTGSAEPGVLRLRGLPAGEHRITVPGDGITVRVVPRAADHHGRPPGSRRCEWVALPTLSVEVPPPAPVLAAVGVTADGIDVTIADTGPRTRVHLLGTLLKPAPAWSEDLATTVRLPQLRPHTPRESQYVSGRDIGDEYRYVLDRQNHPRRPGTLLDRPPVLLNPWSLRTTETGVKHATMGGGWAGAPPAPSSQPYGAAGARGGGGPGARMGTDPAYLSYDFLGSAPVVIVGLRPDEDGRIHVSRSLLGEAQVIEVVCVDPAGTTSRTVTLPPRELPVRDLRLAEALPADRHLREDRRLVPLRAGASLTITDRATSRIQVVDTVAKLYRALCALGGDPDLAAWDFLPRWGLLSRTERLALYSKHACHELSLFVHFKDRPLFDEVVRPYLANKLHLTFVDHWLLGHDLTAWCEPWRLGRLNAVERALLARRLPEVRPAIARLLGDRVELLAPEPERDDRLVNTLLAGGRLSGESLALDALEQEASDEHDDAPKRDEGGERARSAARDSAPKSMKRAARAEMSASLDLDQRNEVSPLYRSVDRTREWAEHNWWHKRIEEQGPELVAPSRLWRDLAAHTEGPFLSGYVADAAESFAASVSALAVLDLPFAAEPSPITVRGAGATLRATGDTLVALAELAPVDGPPTGEILVGQSTFRTDDPTEWDGAEEREKTVTGERTTGVAYTRQVVITNPTSRTWRLAISIQIPAGAIAVDGGIPTRTTHLVVGSYETERVSVSYTFPAEGVFAHYGARVFRGDTLVAAAPSEAVTVVRVPTDTDTGSWAHVSQRGSVEDVIAFLSRENLGRVDLGRVAWRLRDADVFRRITATLADRQVYDDGIWAYALLHHDRARAAEWLAHREELAPLGPLRTSLLTLDPVTRGIYQHLEYAPLVNARAHQLGERRSVLNDGLSAQWRVFLERVATEAAPAPDDWLAAAHYLFTMDRPDDAVRALSQVPPDAGAALQRDYLTAYAAALSGDLATARARSTPHTEHPVERWRHRFAAVVAMLDEVEGAVRGSAVDPDSRDAKMAELAARQPALAAKIEEVHVVLDHQNLETATLRFHRMDIELLFSREPFLGAAGDRFSFVDPGASVEVTLDPGGRTRVALPADVRRENMVIEVVAGPVRQTVTHLAHDLAVAVAAPYGQLQVRRASTGALLSAAYVKVYGRDRGGRVQFYKDGYTDLRGRLDYATLSTNDLDQVERFALLVVHDEAGSTVVEADPPTR